MTLSLLFQLFRGLRMPRKAAAKPETHTFSMVSIGSAFLPFIRA
jgi:hypothetical protein